MPVCSWGRGPHSTSAALPAPRSEGVQAATLPVEQPAQGISARRRRTPPTASAAVLAPPRQRVGERALERHLRRPARGGPHALGRAAYLGHLVRADERRVDDVL